MNRKWLFIVVAAIMLVPWPIAYAFDSAQAAETPVAIQPADPSLAPQIQAFGHAIGGVDAGELYRVDATRAPADTQFTLYLINANDMVECYRYMNLNIGIYALTGVGDWIKVTTANGVVPDIYLTMQSGFVNFTLPGSAMYKITIDDGCFYCYGVNAAGYTIAPEFNLATN